MPNVTRSPPYHQAENFSQQIAGTHSVPYGLIQQEPLAVFLETKLGSSVGSDQLQRHCRTIAERLQGRTGSFLISLTSGEVGQAIPEEVTALAKEHGIKVVAITFGQLVNQIVALPDMDLALQETLDEFGAYIVSQGLIDRKEQVVAAMLTGTSWQDNLACGVYYEPIDRNPKRRRAAFLGLYHDKQVSHVGRIVAVVGAKQGTWTSSYLTSRRWAALTTEDDRPSGTPWALHRRITRTFKRRNTDTTSSINSWPWISARPPMVV